MNTLKPIEPIPYDLSDSNERVFCIRATIVEESPVQHLLGFLIKSFGCMRHFLIRFCDFVDVRQKLQEQLRFYSFDILTGILLNEGVRDCGSSLRGTRTLASG